MTRGDEARRLLRRFRAGMLATHSAKHQGYPYASALPFCTDQRGRVVVLISHLAEHTHNVERDSRVAFAVSPMDAGLQTQARATVLGDIAPAGDEMLAARYLRIFPAAREQLAIGGFRFWAIQPKQVRLIAGFGSLHWIDGESLLAPELPVAGNESDIVEHMNADHARALLDYCRYVHGLQPAAAEMIGIDCDGFDLRADGASLRFEFDHRVDDAEQARAQLVALAKAARA